MPRALSAYGPPVALMGVIFALSAQPDLGADLGTVGLVARKLAHMAEYGLLWLLWVRALGPARIGAAAALTLLYAVSDEWHQTFVQGRVGSPLDVLVDAAGMTAAWWLWRSRRASSWAP